MCPIVLGRHRWQIEELNFAKRVCLGAEPMTLVDIGSNMGLFSRQLLIAIPAITKVVSYEPEPENFACMVHNLSPFGDRVTMIEAAVSNRAGQMEFYLDPTNNGNFSLAIDAMPPNFSKITVEVRDVGPKARHGTASASSISRIPRGSTSRSRQRSRRTSGIASSRASWKSGRSRGPPSTPRRSPLFSIVSRTRRFSPMPTPRYRRWR
jgi:FkbM family methyltransferase